MPRTITGGILALLAAASISACAKQAPGDAANGENGAVAIGDSAAAQPAPTLPLNASAPSTPDAQPTALPFKPGWYALGDGAAKCSKDDDIRDYAELRADRKTWDVSPAGEINVVEITHTGSGRYRTTEVLHDEMNKEDRHSVDYEQLTPTSFTRHVSKSDFWPDGTVTFQLCKPEDTPPNDL